MGGGTRVHAPPEASSDAPNWLLLGSIGTLKGQNYLKRFTGRADAYSKYRPGYPREVLGILKSECGLSAKDSVADIGSGTGILAELFLKDGTALVYCVEPNDDMRLRAEENLSGRFPRSFRSVNGTAENTTLPGRSVDLVTVGQAFHWFDPRAAKKEFLRILRPPGVACVLYNDRTADGGAMSEYNRIVSPFQRANSVPHVDDAGLSRFYRSFRKFALPNHQTLSLAGLAGRALSAGYSPHPDDKSGRSSLTKDLQAMFERYSKHGRLTLEYTTRLYVGEL